jgi:hypothetical protein
MKGLFTAAACWFIILLAACPQHCTAGSELVVRDLWDMPHSLESICNGQETLLFLCDLSISTCREGAVYFDNRADGIKAGGIRPVCVFVGKPSNIRQAVLNLDLALPAYIDERGLMYENLLDQKVLPALILLDGTGNVVRIVYGGGESLDHNLRIIMPIRTREDVDREAGKSRRWRWIAVLATAVAVGVLVLALD